MKFVISYIGTCLAHHCCAAWSEGVIQADDYSLLYVDKAVFTGLSQVKFIAVKTSFLLTALMLIFYWSFV